MTEFKKPRFKKNYDKPFERKMDMGKPGKTQQQFLDQNNPHSVVQRYTQTTKVPQYLDVSDIDPLTHTQKINDLKKKVDSEKEEIQKQENIKKEKEENEQIEKLQERLQLNKNSSQGSTDNQT